jgi:hypothetical protein
VCLSAVALPNAVAAQERYEQLQYAAPSGVRQALDDRLVFTDSSDKSVCSYGILRAAKSTDPRRDFEAGWSDVVRALGLPGGGPSLPPQPKTLASGYVQVVGSGTGNRPSGGGYYLRLYNYSGNGQRLTAFAYYTSSLRCATRTGAWESALMPVGSTTGAAAAAPTPTAAPAKPPAAAPVAPPAGAPAAGAPAAGAPAAGAPMTPPPAGAGPRGATTGWAYGTTNFADGWSATAGEQFVTATRGAVKVFLHHPRNEDTEYMSDKAAQTTRFWNLLVAPRYSSVTNLYVERYSLGGFEPINYAYANAVDRATNARVFVVLMKKFHAGGRWTEIVTPDRATYEREFGAYRQDDTEWQRLLALPALNRFSIGASDLVGTWTNAWASATNMVYVATGWSTGMAYAGGNTEVTFNGGRYSESVSIGEGIAPNIRWRTATFQGNATVPDPWHLTLTGQYQGATKKFRAWYEIVLGGRMLHLELEDGSSSPETMHLVRSR